MIVTEKREKQRSCNSALKLLISHELQGRQEDDIPTPINYTGAGQMGRLEQVAYYENPGILMIVQSVEDQDTSRFHRGKM